MQGNESASELRARDSVPGSSRGKPATLRLATDASVPVTVSDTEAARLLWPLLVRGVSRTLLLGKLVVVLGIDSASANRRLGVLLDELAEAGVVAAKA